MSDKYNELFQLIKDWDIEPEIVKLAMSLGLYYFDEISFGKLSEIYNLGQSV